MADRLAVTSNFNTLRIRAPFCPEDLLSTFCAYVYSASLLPPDGSLDPLLVEYDPVVPTSPLDLPSSYPADFWPEFVSRKTLAALCLVNHAWYTAAKPWLWCKLEVRLPRSWLALVNEIAWNYQEETVEMVMERSIQAAAKAAVTSKQCMTLVERDEQESVLQQSIMDKLEGPPDESISLDLLSPVASREPSSRRIRPKSKSPARWRLIRAIDDAVQEILSESHPAGVYVSLPQDPRPGRFVRHLDFNHFRTIGMRRSVAEGVNCRFVTGERVHALIKEMPNLVAFGATEYMDGALTLEVLNELFLRGPFAQRRGRRGRGVTIDREEEDCRERRLACVQLEAVDLTGCVSAVFVNALAEFVRIHLCDAEETGGDPLVFPGLRRLGMRGVKSITPATFAPFILSFPSLTHLDLSGTRATPELLDALGASTTIKLQSLALARCVMLTGSSIASFLTCTPVTAELRELNLYGDMTFVSPLSADDIRLMFERAPCFSKGRLRYLDLTSAPLTHDLLEACPLLPRLRCLGLSYIPELALNDIAHFIETKAPHTEVVTLISTSPELDRREAPRQRSLALHSRIIRPLCEPPFSFSLSLSAQAAPPRSARTHLRVIELSTTMLTALTGGAGAWRVIRSKGGRAWYVDTASGWCDGVLRRDLAPEHPLRVEMERLADANGNVSSDIGWHARKMEVLHGHGMLGHENGMYGAVSFAASFG
ncbi:hypothetical protein FISHEDRAFT_56488 [Fistulina hepatica ATCC 64428]|uniref:RNI-like protein n=1 Tax=Fistulina hepatica ATCC 64428 TaxID=1128425 RepID=A0A0D7AJS9_9AGAR|nr:hypothetical protein FISHEDRAFT_56488 [Fistulina hepatica ATCC 64428]